MPNSLESKIALSEMRITDYQSTLKQQWQDCHNHLTRTASTPAALGIAFLCGFLLKLDTGNSNHHKPLNRLLEFGSMFMFRKLTAKLGRTLNKSARSNI